MRWHDQVFNYCERGLDPSFWAEPVNALSNAAFVAAAAAAGRRQLIAADCSLVPREALAPIVVWAMIGLVALIGIGSFLFHTHATRWALLADVLPITVFMLAYLALALRAYLTAPWLVVVLALPAFVLAGTWIGSFQCTGPAGTRVACFNGSLGYVPALVSLWLIGALAMARGVPAGRLLLAAGAVFLASLTLRSLDFELCHATALLGRARGTHVFWHLFNAATLYLLLRAAIDHRRPVR